jgi:hypothetical protein
LQGRGERDRLEGGGEPDRWGPGGGEREKEKKELGCCGCWAGRKSMPAGRATGPRGGKQVGGLKGRRVGGFGFYFFSKPFLLKPFQKFKRFSNFKNFKLYSKFSN